MDYGRERKVLAASPEDAKVKRTRRKKADEEAGEVSDPKWVEEMFELVEGLGRMISDMDREEKKWRKKMEKRLSEMQEMLKGPETEEGSDKESEKKNKGKGKEKEKELENNEDVDMSS